jgi:hypothetical protein
MNFDLCANLLHHLDRGRLKIGKAPADVIIWLNNLNLPPNLAHIIQYYWVSDDCCLLDRSINLWSAKSIQDDEETQPLLAAEFLKIGEAMNGDCFVIDFSTESCSPGFVNHEECTLGQSDPREYFQPIASSFEALLKRVDEGCYIPEDYFEAEDYNEA